MRISQKSIEALAKIIAGDRPDGYQQPLSPYRGGPRLVKFFNSLGFQDEYGPGFETRRVYAASRLGELNETPQLDQAVRKLLDPREFLRTPFKPDDVVAHLNEYLQFDGVEIVKLGHFYGMKKIGGTVVDLQPPAIDSATMSREVIDEQLRKCDEKIAVGDFSGAITNARALLEAVLLHIEGRLDGSPPPYDGDLPKLYKRVQKRLNLVPERSDISDPLKHLLGGLVSIVNGLASLRNTMSDAHAVTYRPSAHHAKLAVNAAKTVADFVFETYTYQLGRGTVTSQSKGPNIDTASIK